MKAVRWSGHALQMLKERGIEEAWALAALGAPERAEADPSRNGRFRAWRRVAEFGGRRLRVVYDETDEELIVVTLFFDRNAGRLP